MELSQIPLELILEEIENRCSYYVFACGRIEDGGQDVFDCYWNGEHLKNLGLCTKLINDINKESR